MCNMTDDTGKAHPLEHRISLGVGSARYLVLTHITLPFLSHSRKQDGVQVTDSLRSRDRSESALFHS